MREYHDARAARVAALGEAWINFLSAETLHSRLREIGFAEIEDLGPAEVAERFFGRRGSDPGARGGHILRAATRSFSV
jgi:hypothetical protein